MRYNFSKHTKNQIDNTQKNDLEKKIYDCIQDSTKWDNVLIGGSFALQKFTNDEFKPNDIDIYIGEKSKVNYVNKMTKIYKCIGLDNPVSNNITKYNYNSSVIGRTDNLRNNIDNNLPPNIQFIQVNSNNLNDTLNSITHSPCCLNYYVKNNLKIFNVPEYCTKSLFTKIIYNSDINKERRKIYEQRGYTFK